MADVKFDLLPLDEVTVIKAELNHLDPESIMWDEHISVKYMNDHHLKNAAAKLLGFGNDEYNAPDELKALWARLLRVEWKKRLEARKAAKNS
jgi:hypothetical protein